MPNNMDMFASSSFWPPALAAISAALNPNRSIQVPNTFGGRALGFGSRLLGGFAGSLAQQRAREDLLNRYFSIAGQGIDAAGAIRAPGAPITMPILQPPSPPPFAEQFSLTGTQAPPPLFPHLGLTGDQPARPQQRFSLFNESEQPVMRVGETTARRPSSPAEALRLANPEQRKQILGAMAVGMPPSMLFPEPEKPVNVAEGGTLIDPQTGQVIFQSQGRPQAVRPGGALVNRSGKVVFEAPTAPPFANVNPADFTRESIAEFQKGGDYSTLQRRPEEPKRFSTIEPHHYTPESIAKFNETGKHSVLRRAPTEYKPDDPQVQRRRGLEIEKLERDLRGERPPLSAKDKQQVLNQTRGEARRIVEGQFRGVLGQIDISSLGKTSAERSRRYKQIIDQTARELAEERGFTIEELGARQGPIQPPPPPPGAQSGAMPEELRQYNPSQYSGKTVRVIDDATGATQRYKSDGKRWVLINEGEY